MSSSSLAISLALRYIDDAQKIISRTIEQLKDPKLQEHLIELTVAQNHISTVANHVKTLKGQIADLEKFRSVEPRNNGTNGYKSRSTKQDRYSPTFNSPRWSSPELRDQDDRIRVLTNKVSGLEKELRETIYEKDALISVKMEELAHLQERLDGRDTLLLQREEELDELRSRVHENARTAFSVKQEELDGLGHKLQEEKDHQLIQRAGEVEELHKRLSEVSSERNSRAPPQAPALEHQPGFIPQDFLNSNYPPNVILQVDEFGVVLSNERNLAIPRDVGSLACDGVWRHYHDEIAWGYGSTRYDRCVVIAPNIVYSRDKQRYEKEFRHHRLGQTKDLFWRREIKGMREWFYLGRYQCIAAVTIKPEDARFVNKQAPRALARRTNEECMIIKNLYEIDALQCRCIALERVGFNQDLRSAFARHYTNGLKRKDSFEREERNDWKRRR